MILFRALLVIDVAAAAVAAIFFLIGLADGSVSSFNIGLWLVVLGGLAAILASGLILQRTGYPTPAKSILALLAVPAVLCGAFFLILILAAPNWR